MIKISKQLNVENVLFFFNLEINTNIGIKRTIIRIRGNFPSRKMSVKNFQIDRSNETISLTVAPTNQRFDTP